MTVTGTGAGAPPGLVHDPGILGVKAGHLYELQYEFTAE